MQFLQYNGYVINYRILGYVIVVVFAWSVFIFAPSKLKYFIEKVRIEQCENKDYE